MATFAWAESAGTSVTEEPRVNAAQFGDGYEQRAPGGLNPIDEEWSVQFNAVGRTGGDAIVAFFREHAGWLSFDWTPLWAQTPIKVICPSWSRSQIDEVGESNITAKFRRVYEP